MPEKKSLKCKRPGFAAGERENVSRAAKVGDVLCKPSCACG